MEKISTAGYLYSDSWQIEERKVGGADRVTHGLNFGWLKIGKSAEMHSV